MKLKHLLYGMAVAYSLAWGQQPFPPGGASQIAYVIADPTGNACGQNQIDLLVPSGKIYTCVNGTFALYGGSGSYPTITGANGVSITGTSAAPVIGLVAGNAVLPTTFDCGDTATYPTLNNCLDALKTFVTTNESGSGLAGQAVIPQGSVSLSPAVAALTLTAAANASAGSTVYTGTITGGAANAYAGLMFVVTGFDAAANNGNWLATASTATTLTLSNPAGTSDTHAASVMSPYRLIGGMQIDGIMPRVQYVPGTMPDLNMIFNGGTVINCGGAAVCFTGFDARGVRLARLGFSNYTQQAILFGSNNVDGLAFSNLYDLYAIGSGTLNGTYGAFMLVNSQHVQMDRLFAYDVNQGLNITQQSSLGQYGNLAVNDSYVYTYAKSATNSNNTIPGAFIGVLNPATGSATALNNVVLNRFQVNSYNGDATATNVQVAGYSSSAEVTYFVMNDADLEGGNEYGVTLAYTTLSKINISTSVGNTYDIQYASSTEQNTFSCSSNCKIAPGPGSDTWNNFNGLVNVLPATNSGRFVGFFTDYSTAGAFVANGQWVDEYLNLGGPPVTAQAFISQSQTTFGISGCTATGPVGGGSAGQFVSGTTGSCTVVVTPHGLFSGTITAPHGWTCWGNDLTTTTDTIKQTASSTTTATLSGVTASGDTINFGCMGF